MKTDSQNKTRSEENLFLEKIVVDIGVGRASTQPGFTEKILPQIMRDAASLSGQKPQERPSKKSIAGFKVREGQVVGLRITLRRAKMLDFFERLIKIVLPRVRDFNGIKLSAIDKGGVLNVGIREQYPFPEIVPEQSPISFSLGISAVPRLRNRENAVEKFKKLGVPLREK